MAANRLLQQLEIADTDFVVCDVETTGLSPDKNRITEIALLRVRGGEIVDRYSSLINPHQFIPAEITQLTGITNAMVYAAPDAEEVMPVVRQFVGDAVFVAHNARFDRQFVDATLRRIGGEALQSPMLCTARLARRLTPKKSGASLGTLAAQYGIRIRSRHRAGGDAEATARLLLVFFSVLEEEFDLTDVGELLSFQNRQIYRVTGEPKYYTRLSEQLQALPHGPGVYFMHDKRGGILYIGKARDLKERVSSYFYHNIGHTEKIRRLVRGVHGISYRETDTELTALLTESRLIKQHQPAFNTQLKNYRRYPFIRIDMASAWPTVDWSYDLLDDGAEYYGPFRSRFAVEDAIDSINKLFRLRECEGTITPKAGHSPCLYFDIKRCAAPCAALVSEEEYRREAEAVAMFLQGEHDHMLELFRGRMHARAEALDFEGAAALRDRIAAVERIIRQQRLMVHSVRRQNIVILTPARGTRIEAHLIHHGRLAATMLLDQKAIARKEVERQLREVYAAPQQELFGNDKADIDEMRIIASWCLTRRDESRVVDIDAWPEPSQAVDAVLDAARGNP